MKKVQLILLAFLMISLASCKSAKYKNLDDGLYADVQTDKGNIVLKLEFEKAPNTVANFVSLAEGNNPEVDKKFKGKPFYDGLKFHRVIKNFMIQGGDPDGNGSGGPGYRFEDEFPVDNEGNFLLTHKDAGVLSMANSGRNTNGSQFFITHRATPHLDGKHSVFGHVVIGQNVVDSIEKGDIIKKIDIIRNGSAARKFDAVTVFENHMKAFEEKLKKKEEEQKLLKQKAEKAQKQMAKFIADNKQKAKQFSSGLRKLVTKKGTGGKPVQGSTVLVDYAGFFEDGRLFDTSVLEVAKAFNRYDERKDQANAYHPFQMIFSDKATLVPGFKEGMLSMEYGEKAVLFIPSHLAYGEKGAGGVIPPNTDLVFEIEIIDENGTK
jgi:cyclophilin family peptidyl-prolyl cis-trans isomerase